MSRISHNSYSQDEARESLDIKRRKLFGVALVEPEIPPNVGAVSRTCAATGCPLYIVGEVKFREDHPARKRAGLDYWDLVEKIRLPSVAALLEQNPTSTPHFFSKKAKKSIYEVDFNEGDLFIFGCETKGFSPKILEDYSENLIRLPMRPGIRSMNMASCVGIALYEGIRQVLFAGHDRAQRP